MTFTRQRSDGTHETNSFQTSQQSPNTFSTQQSESKFLSFRSTSLPLKNIVTFALTAFAITVPTLLPAEARYYSRYNRYSKSRSYQKYTRTSSKHSTRRAADEVSNGMWGWTKGSQTFLRVRPAATTPFVAKVPRHTKLFVWGKFNGWYRVETPDHIFGWVFHQYVNAPENRKLAELSHAKAKIACDRSSKQLMYGTPQMLQKYYAAYQAPGALRGLEKHGIRVATPAKPQAKTVVAKATTAKVKPVVAKAAPKVVTPKKLTPVAVKASVQPAPASAAVTAKVVQPVAPKVISVQQAAPSKPKVAARPQVVAKSSTHRHLPARSAQSRSYQRRTTKKQRKSTVATVPPMQVSGASPVTAEDILRAREAHLGSRHKTRPTAPAAQLPARIEEKPTTNRDQAAVQPSSTEVFTAPGLPSPLLAKSHSLGTREQLPAPLQGVDGASPVITLVSLKKTLAKSTPAKATTTTSKALPNRGGSPRDYARYAQEKNKFGDGVASQALSYRGMPYIRGSASPRRGFDCSGLVYHLLRQRGYNPPRTAAGLASYGTPVARDKIESGDIVLFANTYRRGVSHVGVYCGNGKFVHAANSRSGVRVDPLFSGYYGKKYYGARRVAVKN